MSMDVPLTVLDIKFNEMVNQTRSGQAHWAGTGPKGVSCRECSHWEFDGYKPDGTLKPASCAMYLTLSYTKGKKFSHEAISCKFFKKNENPPTVSKPRKVT